MPGKAPQRSGKEANGVSKSKKGAKDADEEMTVVVPPSKKQAQAADGDGDVDMAGEEDKGEEVDPAVQAVTGVFALGPSASCKQVF
jgi:26S proteasome regulatory subunit N3